MPNILCSVVLLQSIDELKLFPSGAFKELRIKQHIDLQFQTVQSHLRIQQLCITIDGSRCQANRLVLTTVDQAYSVLSAADKTHI